MASVPPDADHTQYIVDVFKQHHVKLVKKLAARTGSLAQAEDIASEAFAEVLSQRAGTVNFLGPYLYRAAENLAKNWLTHQAMCRRKDPIVAYEPSPHAPPESLLADEEQKALFKRAVEELPPRLRKAIIHRFWDNLTYNEIVLRFAAIGIDVCRRTVERWVSEALTLCRSSVRAAERGRQERSINDHTED